MRRIIIATLLLVLLLTSGNFLYDSVLRKNRSLSGVIGKDFYNEIQSRGIDFPYQVVTATWIDYNLDTWPDLFLAGEDKYSLFINDTSGKFNKLPFSLDGLEDKKIKFASWIDYNNDGCIDLSLSVRSIDSTYFSDVNDNTIMLYKSTCDGKFTYVKNTGIFNAKFASSISWGDYNNDGLLDMYVTNFGPDPLNVLYRNNGDDSFTDITTEAGVEGFALCSKDPHNIDFINIQNPETKYSLQSVWFDFNNDNFIDLLVANDFGYNAFYKNLGNGKFKNITESSGLCRYGTGMGIAIGDFNNDSWQDIYVTNVNMNYLWENNKNETFTQASQKYNTVNPYLFPWGVNFFDIDNDGLLDIFISNGTTMSVTPAPFNKNVYYLNNGKGFTRKILEGTKPNDVYYTSAIADINNDGYFDVFNGYDERVDQRQATPNHTLYINQNNKNNWIKLRLIGKYSNREAIGAKVSVTTSNGTQYRQITNADSFHSQNQNVLVFGLKNIKSVDKITIVWPSKRTQQLTELSSNKLYTIVEQ